MANGRRLHFSPASYAFLYLLRVPADWPAGGDGVGSRSVGSNASPSRPAQVGLSRTSSGGATINTQLAEGEETEPTTRRWCEGNDKRRQQYPPLKSGLWGSVGWRWGGGSSHRSSSGTTTSDQSAAVSAPLVVVVLVDPADVTAAAALAVGATQQCS